MSFVEQEDVLNMFEGMAKHLFKVIRGVEFKESFMRMTWTETFYDLEITVETGNHQQLLQGLWRLRQSVELSRVHTGRNRAWRNICLR